MQANTRKIISKIKSILVLTAVLSTVTKSKSDMNVYLLVNEQTVIIKFSVVVSYAATLKMWRAF